MTTRRFFNGAANFHYWRKFSFSSKEGKGSHSMFTHSSQEIHLLFIYEWKQLRINVKFFFLITKLTLPKTAQNALLEILTATNHGVLSPAESQHPFFSETTVCECLFELCKRGRLNGHKARNRNGVGDERNLESEAKR